MNCSHCDQPLPDKYPAAYCPFCGKDLPSESPDPAKELPPAKIRWIWFWVTLLTPPVLTLLSALLVRLAMPAGARNEGISPMVALIGSGIGGIASGTIIGIKLGRTIPARIGISVLCSGVMCVVCIILCFFGCNLGGYRIVFE